MSVMKRLYYQTKVRPSLLFKRYMFRWDGVVSGSVFQLSRIMIDDIDLPYTLVNWGASGGSTISNEPASAMIASTSSYTDPNNKWCRTSVSGSSYGWIIFDLPNTHEIQSYRVLTANDTLGSPGRNPTRIRLYGTTSEATTESDASWVLLSDVSNSGNSVIPTDNRTWSNYFIVEPEEITENHYLLAPSDLSKGTGLRYEVQTGNYTVITDLGDTVYQAGSSSSQSVSVQLNVPSTVSDRYILYRWHGAINTYGTGFGASDFQLKTSDYSTICRSRAHYAHQDVAEIVIEGGSLYRQFVKDYSGMYTFIQDGETCWTDASWPNGKDIDGTVKFIVDQQSLVGHFYWRPDTNPDTYPNYKGYVIYSSAVPTAAFFLIQTEYYYAPRADHICVVSSNDLQTLIDY